MRHIVIKKIYFWEGRSPTPHHHHQFILRQKMDIQILYTNSNNNGRLPEAQRLNELAVHYENQNITTYNTCARSTKQKKNKKETLGPKKHTICSNTREKKNNNETRAVSYR